MRDGIRSGASWRRRLRARLLHRPTAALERHLVRNARLGLFDGHAIHDHYARYSLNPQLVNNIHIGESHHLPADRRAAKIAGAAEGPLRIVHAGRADPAGVRDWIETMRILAAEGVDFHATWLGEGLAEALVSATPIAGYDSAFARDLVSGHGGGILVPGQSPALLAREPTALADDRARLGDLIDRAARDGTRFGDEAVFRHRAGLIRANLPPG